MASEHNAEIEALQNACQCLYLEVPAKIANDVKAKAEAVIAQLDAVRQSAFDAGLKVGVEMCEYFCEEEGDIASQAAAAIRSRQQKEDQEVGNAR